MQARSLIQILFCEHQKRQPCRRHTVARKSQVGGADLFNTERGMTFYSERLQLVRLLVHRRSDTRQNNT
ncbi:hypothetical protein RRG08_017664 [Elysia crispata]|uniref:Uncharacterized protein n=1 Tax=Elysia crispata TaxID=231223 RepID=A0AAE0ZB57_9GAST|nr:hypothetical protein RRG08_017664 [Elysia crispata]